VVSFTRRPLYPQGKSPWYPLNRRPGGPQSRSGGGGEEKNSQPPSGIEPSRPQFLEIQIFFGSLERALSFHRAGIVIVLPPFTLCTACKYGIATARVVTAMPP
jgi:hypothetical protein